jgi:hypothetical protein
VHFPEAEVVTPSDPTDNALAAIASVLEHPLAAIASILEPASQHEPEKAEVDEKPIASELIEANGYSKSGPGPMAAIRFKWTVRRADDGQYYVDETIGENSAPIASGPMAKEAAIALVNEREGEARRRFEQLKSEMTGRAAAANLVRKDSGEI